MLYSDKINSKIFLILYNRYDRKGVFDVYAYVVVGYLDKETENKFKNIWELLSDKGLTHYGVEIKGKRPHITIADYDSLDQEKFIRLFDNYYKDKEKINLSLTVLGTFIDTSTLFIAPTLSKELITFHDNHHNSFCEFNMNENSFYLPGRWIPHCTIASRLDETKMLEVFRFCQSALNKISCQIDEVAVIQIKLNEKGIAIKEKQIYSKILGSVLE